MNNFDKNWRSAKKSIFRLEGRAEYRVPEEQESLKKWKQGELDLGKDKELQKWLGSLKSAKKRGIVIQRVRVVPKSLPEYIKFQIDVWQKYSSKNGEEFFFLNESDYQEIIAGLGFNPKDFWLFDDQGLLIVNYSPTGQFTGDILIADGGMAKRYCDLKAKLLQKSVPLASFVKSMKTE